ncbi:MAG: NADH-quinone oxidoreductase subunit J [Bacteroidota bacterium]
MTVEQILFYLFAASAIATASLMVIQRNPVMSAIYLVGNFFCIAALYLLLRAQFLAVIQIVVYTGAIMVLVIFVIMLLNLGDEQALAEKFSIKKILGTGLVFGFLLEMLYVFGFAENTGQTFPSEQARIVGTVEGIGDALFGRFLLPFEVTSLLLLAAIVGAVILAKRRV